MIKKSTTLSLANCSRMKQLRQVFRIDAGIQLKKISTFSIVNNHRVNKIRVFYLGNLAQRCTAQANRCFKLYTNYLLIKCLIIHF